MPFLLTLQKQIRKHQEAYDLAKFASKMNHTKVSTINTLQLLEKVQREL